MHSRSCCRDESTVIKLLAGAAPVALVFIRYVFAIHEESEFHTSNP
jgi:hypothetical protein